MIELQQLEIDKDGNRMFRFELPVVIRKVPCILSESNQLVFENDKELMGKLEDIKDVIVNYLFENSEVCFSGKRFSKSKIQKGLSIDLTNDIKFDENCCFYNKLGEKYDEVPKETNLKADLKVDRIVFVRNKIIMPLFVTSVKVLIQSSKQIYKGTSRKKFIIEKISDLEDNFFE